MNNLLYVIFYLIGIIACLVMINEIEWQANNYLRKLKQKTTFRASIDDYIMMLTTIGWPLFIRYFILVVILNDSKTLYKLTKQVKQNEQNI